MHNQHVNICGVFDVTQPKYWSMFHLNIQKQCWYLQHEATLILFFSCVFE
jgi:hypothetical protein